MISQLFHTCIAVDLQTIYHRVFHVHRGLKLSKLLHVLPCFHLKTEQLPRQHAYPYTMGKQQTVIEQSRSHVQEVIHPHCKHGKAVGSRPILVMYITQRPVGLCHAPPFVHTYVGNVGKFQMTQFIQTWQNLWQQLPLLTQRRSGLLSALQFRGVNSAGVNMAQTSVGLSACSSPRLVKPTCLSGITGPPTFAVLSPWRIKYKVCNKVNSLQECIH